MAGYIIKTWTYEQYKKGGAKRTRTIYIYIYIYIFQLICKVVTQAPRSPVKKPCELQLSMEIMIEFKVYSIKLELTFHAKIFVFRNKIHGTSRKIKLFCLLLHDGRRFNLVKVRRFCCKSSCNYYKILLMRNR